MLLRRVGAHDFINKIASDTGPSRGGDRTWVHGGAGISLPAQGSRAGHKVLLAGGAGHWPPSGDQTGLGFPLCLLAWGGQSPLSQWQEEPDPSILKPSLLQPQQVRATDPKLRDYFQHRGMPIRGKNTIKPHSNPPAEQMPMSLT